MSARKLGFLATLHHSQSCVVLRVVPRAVMGRLSMPCGIPVSVRYPYTLTFIQSWVLSYGHCRSPCPGTHALHLPLSLPEYSKNLTFSHLSLVPALTVSLSGRHHHHPHRLYRTVRPTRTVSFSLWAHLQHRCTLRPPCHRHEPRRRWAFS